MNECSLDHFRRGAVRCVFCDDVGSTAVAMEHWIAGLARPARLHLQRYRRLPDHLDLQREFILQLAEAARLLWPMWFGSPPPRQLAVESLSQAVEAWATALRRQRPGAPVNSRWLEAAARACVADMAPLLPNPTLAAQARQLALALTDQDLLLAVAWEDERPACSARLLSFSRSLEWFARTTDARVVALAPRSLAGRPELDGVNSQALGWEAASRHAPPQPLDQPRSADQLLLADQPLPADQPLAADPPLADVHQRSAAPDHGQDERKHLAYPILGRPHPASPGEQLLAARLNRDPELSGLFCFNERVRTRGGSRPLVDLVWRDGRVVIEIDSYGYHTTRAAFHADRHRDCELQLSGYLVLRLPHDFVVQDVQLAVERVREFVLFRRQHPFIQSEATA